MSSSNGKVRFTPDEIAAVPEVVIRLEMLGNEDKSFELHFDDQDPSTDRKYGNIATQNGKRTNRLRDKDLDAAMLFLFEKKFKYSTLDFNIYSDNGDGPDAIKEENGYLRVFGEEMNPPRELK